MTDRRGWTALSHGSACLPANSLPCCAAVQVARERLVALGTCIGKFTHSGKFRVTIGALDLLAQYAKYKVGQA